MKHKVFFITLVFMTAGCASVQTGQDEKILAAAKVYKRSVDSISLGEVKSDICAKGSSQLKGHWDWKLAVQTSSSCLKNRQFTTVEEIGNQLSTREPAAPWGPYFLASVARERGELERAQWMSELAMKRAPEIGILHYLRGQVLWDKKEYGPAVASFEKSVTLDSSIVPAHLFLGQIYYRDQEFSKATKHFYAVLRSDSRHPVALSGLAESQLREGNTENALDVYARLVEAYPQDGLYLARMGEIYEVVVSDLPRALSVYRRLKEAIQSGQIKKNGDISLDAKIKELEVRTQAKRTVAAKEEKGRVVR